MYPLDNLLYNSDNYSFVDMRTILVFRMRCAINSIIGIDDTMYNFLSVRHYFDFDNVFISFF